MKKRLLALILGLALTLGFAIPAFAGTRAYMEWNEKTGMYEITLIEDDDDDSPIYPEQITPYNMDNDFEISLIPQGNEGEEITEGNDDESTSYGTLKPYWIHGDKNNMNCDDDDESTGYGTLKPYWIHGDK